MTTITNPRQPAPEIAFSILPGYPDFGDLPWDTPLENWEGICTRLVEAPRGPGRHTVLFVNYDGVLFSLKELPAGVAQREYKLLTQIEAMRIPAVMPVGHLSIANPTDPTSVLITRYLEYAIPYRTLMMTGSLGDYRKHLLDAMAGLLVQLHLRGVYWGDCSLSNTLFRRDAGALKAYLVDAETAIAHPEHIPAILRHQEMDIMEENIDQELAELALSHQLPQEIPANDTGAYIRVRYQRLWEEITREEILTGDSFHIQERIRALNAMGYSVGGVDFYHSEHGEAVHLRVVVTDRNFHRDQLLNLTGLSAEEKQARLMMNEIHELQTWLSISKTPLSVAAYHWLVNSYQPVVERLQPLIKGDMSAEELYCQVLEHKWYLSERARRDVGHVAAVEDYLKKFAQD